MPHPPLHIWVHPHDQSLQPLYLPYITAAVHFLQTYKITEARTRWPSHPPAHSSSISDSRACTSTAVSCGDPNSCGVERTGEQPSTVASESDHRSSKVRGSSSSMLDPHSHDHHRLRSSTSCSISHCSSSVLPDNGLELFLLSLHFHGLLLLLFIFLFLHLPIVLSL